LQIITDKIKSIDMFGEDVGFYANGRSKTYTSWCGTLFTLLVIFFCFTYLYKRALDMFAYTETNFQ